MHFYVYSSVITNPKRAAFDSTTLLQWNRRRSFVPGVCKTYKYILSINWCRFSMMSWKERHEAWRLITTFYTENPATVTNIYEGSCNTDWDSRQDGYWAHSVVMHRGKTLELWVRTAVSLSAVWAVDSRNVVTGGEQVRPKPHRQM
jgi:hypothetical protein